MSAVRFQIASLTTGARSIPLSVNSSNTVSVIGSASQPKTPESDHSRSRGNPWNGRPCRTAGGTCPVPSSRVLARASSASQLTRHDG